MDLDGVQERMVLSLGARISVAAFVGFKVRFPASLNVNNGSMLLKKSLENGRLLAMLRPGCSRGRSGNDGTTVWRPEAAVLLFQSRRSRSL